MDADGDLVTGATGLDSEISKDGGTFADCTSEATEIATASGVYYLDLTSTEMNADTVAIIVKTTTSGAKTTVIVMYPEELGDYRADVVWWNGTVVATPGTAGVPSVDAIRHGGTTQTGRDIGASVLLSTGTGTGQLDFTSGVVKANLAQILGTALTETAGLLAGGFKKFFNVATPTGTVNSIPDAVAGATGGLFVAGTNAATTITTGLTTTFTGNLAGSVGSVTGAVGSVTGNVGGNVTGSVGTVNALAAGSVNAAAIATGAIDADALDSGAVFYIQSGLATAAALATLQTNVTTIDDFIDTEIGAIVTAVGTTIPALIDALPTASENASAGLSAVYEGSLTVQHGWRLSTAALTGKLSGAATTTINIRDNADTKNRISATVDSSGNRSAVTLDAS